MILAVGLEKYSKVDRKIEKYVGKERRKEDEKSELRINDRKDSCPFEHHILASCTASRGIDLDKIEN